RQLRGAEQRTAAGRVRHGAQRAVIRLDAFLADSTDLHGLACQIHALASRGRVGDTFARLDAVDSEEAVQPARLAVMKVRRADMAVRVRLAVAVAFAQVNALADAGDFLDDLSALRSIQRVLAGDRLIAVN